MFQQSKPQDIQTVTAATPAETSSTRGFAAAFGLDPRVALLTVVVDAMLFGGDAITLGALIPIGIAVGAILGLIVYKIQIKWHGDDHDSALIKSLIVALLTSIPAPLGALFAIPTGLLGIVESLRRRKK
ncbi:MAG TPA: hypothetical protein VHX86_10650 [Tepidisphaeraceae bacterium]|jgi:hypothetical protein|nr:hypothetical protein [Tepidisphaeraceae bacterium]